MKKRGKRMMGKVKKSVAIVMMACMLFTMEKVNSNVGKVNSNTGKASSDAGIMLCGEGLGFDWLELQ